MLSTKEWRRNRDRAGILLGLVYKVPRDEAREKAWQVYRKWANAEISYREAEKKLRELAGEAKAKA